MKYPIAVWSGVSSFFATVLAIGAINIFSPTDLVKFTGGILVGVITAGTVYSRERLTAARQSPTKAGVLRVQDTGEKKMFSLELDEHPEELATKKEVVFRVVEEPPVKDA